MTMRDVKNIEDVTASQLPAVLKALLDYLNVELIEEITPDYTAYEFRHLTRNRKK